MEPHHPYGLPNLAHVLVALGRAAEAVPYYREVLELTGQKRIPGTYEKAHVTLALALKEAGDLEGSKKVAQQGKDALLKSREGSPLSSQDLLIMSQLEALAGRISEAKKYLEKAISLGIKDTYTMMNLAELYAIIGDGERAIETLKKVLELGYSDPFFPLIFPDFQPIRNDPRFRVLFKLKSE